MSDDRWPATENHVVELLAQGGVKAWNGYGVALVCQWADARVDAVMARVEQLERVLRDILTDCEAAHHFGWTDADCRERCLLLARKALAGETKLINGEKGQSMKIVYYEGMGLSVRERVLESMCLQEGQNITEEQVREAIGLDAKEFADELDRRRAAGEPNIPDTSDLRKLLK